MTAANFLLTAIVYLPVSVAPTFAAGGTLGYDHGSATSTFFGAPAPRERGRPPPIILTDNAYNVKTVTVMRSFQREASDAH